MRPQTDIRIEFDEKGELRISAPANSHYIRAKKQDEEYQKKKGRQHAFTFTDMENIQEIISGIPEKHCGYLLYLQCFLGYEYMLQIKKMHMGKAEMMKVLQIKGTAFRLFIKDMMDNEIMFETVMGGETRYGINPKFHFRGQTNNIRVVKSFSASVKKLYGAVNPKDLGFVYKLLPFIHQQTNTLCANPYEQDIGAIRYLCKEQIAEITGVDEKTVYRKLRKLKFDNQYVFAEVIRGKHHFYKVNPFVFYRKNGYPDPTLREIFLLKKGFTIRENE